MQIFSIVLKIFQHKQNHKKHIQTNRRKHIQTHGIFEIGIFFINKNQPKPIQKENQNGQQTNLKQNHVPKLMVSLKIIGKTRSCKGKTNGSIDKSSSNS